MILASAELRRLERVHVRAWPALETATIAGWLWRYSGGGSQRANSVSTLDFDGADATAALDDIEARYREMGVPARLHTFGQGRPAGLPDMLSARGYGEGEATITMAKRLEAVPQAGTSETSQEPGREWLEVYLGAITENRRTVNAAILEAVPKPRSFLACRRNGKVVSTALGVADRDCAVIECVATGAGSRRQGGARTVLGALEAWAQQQGVRLLGLQVAETNAAAIALYGSLGFRGVDRNRFWVRE
jgi:ribosomal protein S18 acetylase RimI-like enzyme